MNAGRVALSVALSDQGGQSSPGQDLSGDFETQGSIALEVGSLSLTVELAGADLTEPYSFIPSNAADVIAFEAAVRALATVPDATLTLDDGSLPDAEAPTVAIAAQDDISEAETASLSASVSGGTYDALAYAWSDGGAGGSFSAQAASTVYTPPDVGSDTAVTITCTVTATGTGTNAADGTSDTASDTESFTVRAAVDVRVEGGTRHEIEGGGTPLVEQPDPAEITAYAITSTPQAESDTYGELEVIEFTATFDTAVDVTGTPQFPMNLGQSPSGNPEYADYASGSGTTELVFEWVVSDTDEDTNGIYLFGPNDADLGDGPRDGIRLNGGTIRNAGTSVDADLEWPDNGTRGTKSGHKVDGPGHPAAAPVQVTGGIRHGIEGAGVPAVAQIAGSDVRVTGGVRHGIEGAGRADRRAVRFGRARTGRDAPRHRGRRRSVRRAGRARNRRHASRNRRGRRACRRADCRIGHARVGRHAARDRGKRHARRVAAGGIGRSSRGRRAPRD